MPSPRFNTVDWGCSPSFLVYKLKTLSAQHPTASVAVFDPEQDSQENSLRHILNVEFIPETGKIHITLALNTRVEP